jgi:uncharacterized protein YecT (DUF1311 family)
MNKNITICLLIIGLLLSGCVTSQPKRSKLISHWTPNLDQPIGQLEETLAKLEQQQPMNYTISNVAFLYDAKLYILFHDFLAFLPESERAAHISEQHQWLVERKIQVNEAYMKYEGGTFASYSASKASVSATKKRIAEIEGRLKNASYKTDASNGK